MRYLSALFCAALFLLSFSVAVLADDVQEKEKPSSCIEQKVIGHGVPNKIQSVANMNSIIRWLASVKKKHGPEFSQWHTAMDKKVDCRKTSGLLYICNAHGKPCKQVESDEKK